MTARHNDSLQIMAFLSHDNNIITPPDDEQTETQATTESQLFVTCPSVCNQKVTLDKIRLARESGGRAIWNCSHCRKIKKKQAKISWNHFVCVQCTHTQGETWLIQSCAVNCPTKLAIESKKKMRPGKAKVDRAVESAKKVFKRLKLRELVERLKVLKAAWILGKGEHSKPQPWFNYNPKKKTILISRLCSGFAACADEPSVKLPLDFQNAMVGEFDFSDWLTRLALKATGRKNIVFKYNKEFYQDVTNFCDNYDGLKARRSKARTEVVNTDFPNSARLVIPGCNKNNYRHISEDWKNGAQDLSDLQGAAYILGQRNEPTGPHLLLVSRKELKQAAASALFMFQKNPNTTMRDKGLIFKYNDAFYQDVNNFCKDYGDLKKRHPDIISNIENTTFPTSAYLVIPGYSYYKRIPEDWKKGTQDLSDLRGAAYILGRRKKPTGPHLLLVSQKQLKQATTEAVTKDNWIRKQLGISRSPSHKRPTKILGRQQRSKCVSRACCKGR